jgi:hypothetical protein
MIGTIESVATSIDQLQLVQQLAEQARAEGVALIGHRPPGTDVDLRGTPRRSPRRSNRTRRLSSPAIS